MKNITAKIEMGAQTYKLLAEAAGSIFGDTAEDVALYLILRGLQDMVKDGILQWREGQLKLAVRKSDGPPLKVFITEASDRIWCGQCDMTVLPTMARNCTSPFCKAKVKAA